MPKSPYILVLAYNPHEGAKYIQRAKLPRGRWRNVSSASSIRGIRFATVHCLPGFHRRPDKHSILAELRYAKCEWVDVEMPEPEDRVVDQGDGMGQQLTFEDAVIQNALEAQRNQPGPMPVSNMLETGPASLVEIEDAARDAAGVLTPEDIAALEAIEPDVEEKPKQRRRTRCADCGNLHFKDEPCDEDDVAPISKAAKGAPAATPATIFN